MKFVDTNVLLYLASTEPREAAKARVARAILEAGDIALSVQVLQEFYVQSTRTGGRGSLTHQQASLLVESFILRFPVQEMTVSLFAGALAVKERFGISFWDASILEAARLLNCSTVLSEDLSHGQRYGAVVVKNPFRAV